MPVGTYAHPASIAEKRRHAFHALPVQKRPYSLLAEKHYPVEFNYCTTNAARPVGVGAGSLG
jgi:hypothetical protein